MDNQVLIGVLEDIKKELKAIVNLKMRELQHKYTLDITAEKPKIKAQEKYIRANSYADHLKQIAYPESQ